MKFIDKFRQKTEGLSNSEIAKEAALMVKSRLIHRYRQAKSIIANTEISDEKLLRALTLPRDVELLSYFQNREKPVSFPSFSTLAQTCEILADYFPSSLEDLIIEANEICQHEFTFFGRKHKYNVEEINWHYDGVIDYEWPQRHYSQISISQAKMGADIKVPWELARLQHFITLGQVYSITLDERYAIEFSNQILSFARANPPEIGIHWMSPMEVALRSISLSLGFYFFRHSQNFDSETLKALLKLLLSHGTFIEQNLEFSHRITSNHYLSDLVGLLFIGLLFPEFKQSAQWAEFARVELLKEMDKQVYGDGVDWEASTAYHAFVLELFLYSFLLCKEQGIKIDNSYWNKLEKMFAFVQAYLKPDGSAPLIGDCDDGRVIVWRRKPTYDHFYLLAIAAVLFENERYKVTGQPSEECLWIFGPIGWDTYDSMSMSEEILISSAFPEGGVYIQRDDNLYAIIDCGEIGINGQGSHAHNDLLGFELFYRERTFFVDAGSYVYTGDPQARNQFRSTAYHNTLMVDGMEINEIYPGQLFVIGNQAHIKVNSWESNEEYDLLDAEHNGYLRLPQGVIHRRQIHFNKIGCYWLIKDILQGEGSHQFTFFFNFDAGLGLELAEGTRAIINDEQSGVSLALVPLGENGLSVEIVDRYVSKGYGQRAKSWGVMYNLKARAPLEQQFLIAPCTDGDLTSVYELMETLDSPFGD
ncbi:MAG: alginate lyase family protein [Acidobacteriota bacterium]